LLLACGDFLGDFFRRGLFTFEFWIDFEIRVLELYRVSFNLYFAIGARSRAVAYNFSQKEIQMRSFKESVTEVIKPRVKRTGCLTV